MFNSFETLFVEISPVVGYSKEESVLKALPKLYYYNLHRCILCIPIIIEKKTLNLYTFYFCRFIFICYSMFKLF